MRLGGRLLAACFMSAIGLVGTSSVATATEPAGVQSTGAEPDVGAAAPAKDSKAAAKNSAVRTWEFLDLNRKSHRPFADAKTSAVVCVFITTDCPIANYYQPTLGKLAKKYAKQGVRFFLIHSDPDTVSSKAAQHAKEFRIQQPVVLDPEFKIARRLAAEVTPEVFVLDKNGKTIYRGRVNDLYTAFGKRRPQPRREDLELALQALLAGKSVAVPRTKPIGCYIPYPVEKRQR